MGSFIPALMDPRRSPSSARRPNLSIQPQMCGTAVGASGREAAGGSTATFISPGSGGGAVCVPHAGRYSAQPDMKAALIVPTGTPTLPPHMALWNFNKVGSRRSARTQRRWEGGGSTLSLDSTQIPGAEAAPGRRARWRCCCWWSAGDRAASPVRLQSDYSQNRGPKA